MKPAVVVKSPEEVNLNNETLQKYFGYLAMDLVNKYYRPSKDDKIKEHKYNKSDVLSSSIMNTNINETDDEYER